VDGDIGVAAGNVVQVDQAVTATTRATTTVLATTLNHTLSDTSADIDTFNGVAGVTYSCRALGAGTIVAGAGLIITQTGATITTAAGDTFDVEMITGTTCRIKNYILASGAALVVTAASQAEMETATSTMVATTPGLQKNHPAHPKVWISFNGTGTIAIEQSYGVTSITDEGTGDYTITFSTNFSANTYACVANADRTVGTMHATEGMQVVSRAVGAFRMLWANDVPTPTDQALVMAAFFGDQ
jgi:hypothetical protein